ncbi:hypothetical protein SSPS47_18265 [Streptomyces sp. S4.7]|nr:hypothetical protein SSPS47_18265 [Streptomyces sp. S4.7]
MSGHRTSFRVAALMEKLGTIRSSRPGMTQLAAPYQEAAGCQPSAGPRQVAMSVSIWT